HGLLLAYAAGAAVGSTGLTPGGFALVEATLTAALVASGLTASTALASVLAYRLISFWMIMIVGWILMIARTRARTGQTRLYTQVGRGSCGSRARRHSRAGRAAQRSRSLAPGIQVVLLLCSQSVDFGIQRGEREPGDPGVNCRRYAVHPGGQLSLLTGKPCQRKRLDSERDVHHGGRIALARDQVDHAPLSQQNQPPAVSENVFVGMGAHLGPERHRKIGETSYVDLDIEVTGIGQDRPVAHPGHVRGSDHVPGTCRGDEHLAKRRGRGHREHPETAHDGF